MFPHVHPHNRRISIRTELRRSSTDGVSVRRPFPANWTVRVRPKKEKKTTKEKEREREKWNGSLCSRSTRPIDGLAPLQPSVIAPLLATEPQRQRNNKTTKKKKEKTRIASHLFLWPRVGWLSTVWKCRLNETFKKKIVFVTEKKNQKIARQVRKVLLRWNDVVGQWKREAGRNHWQSRERGQLPAFSSRNFFFVDWKRERDWWSSSDFHSKYEPAPKFLFAFHFSRGSPTVYPRLLFSFHFSLALLMSTGRWVWMNF